MSNHVTHKDHLKVYDRDFRDGPSDRSETDKTDSDEEEEIEDEDKDEEEANVRTV